MSSRSSRPTWFGHATMITVEKENELVETIRLGEGLWGLEGLPKKDRAALKKAERASHELVSSYSPLIEKMAREHYSGVPSHRASLEDFIAEAYIVAIQCSRTFSPSKGMRPIRFSSYFSRAVSSALSRMAMRSRSLLSIPIQTMTDARKWSHTRFDMENTGISLSDEEVSEISGVNSNQQEVMRVLGATTESSLDDVIPPGVEDDIADSVTSDYTILVAAIRAACSVTYSTGLLYLMGLVTGEALTTRFLMSVEMKQEVPDYDVDEFLQHRAGYVNHPVIRNRIANEINKRKGLA